MVAVRSRVFASDEELGKRDDDRKPRKMGQWNIKHKPTWRKRRIAIIVLACVGAWLFIHYLPTDLGPVDRRTGLRLPHQFPRASPASEIKQAWDEARAAPEPPAEEEPSTSKPHNYDGPIRFYYLASTLRAGARARDMDLEDRDVLFAASNLNSAGAIIPLACEMARWKRNTVHMAIMGRGDLSIEEIQKINGASKESCNIWWHDARPDFEATSTDDRMEVSVAGGLNHIISFIHPVVVITTDMDSEDAYFAHGVQRKLKQTDLTHIQVPKESPQSLAWAARLDSLSLKAWHIANIDLLVQAPLESSGSLIRLLKSLAVADYSGFSPPRLTIELPHVVDAATMKFLSRFRWPPARYSSAGQNDQLTIRRRIFEQKASVEEASHRFIESFYPLSSNGPHVLLLSPQTELSPVYFHYLKLSVLEYRHSTSVTEIERSLFGISLESPSVHLDGIRPFHPSLTSTPATGIENDAQLTPFRWQAPNTNAALYFGDKWMEAHSFLMKRHSATRKPSMQTHYQTEKKAVSKKSPAWAEYFLQLMLSRAYFLHYPGIELPSALAIVHNELYQLPEEFANMDEDATATGPPASTESVLTVKDDYLQSHHPPPSTAKTLNLEGPLIQKIDQILPLLAPPPEELKQEENFDFFGASPISSHSHPSLSNPAMPRLNNLPLLNHLGETTTFQHLQEVAGFSRVAFRSSAGGCSVEQSKARQVVPLTAEDLFCFDENEKESESPSQLFSEVTPESPSGNDVENGNKVLSGDEAPITGAAEGERIDTSENTKAQNLAGPDAIPVPANVPIAAAQKFQELARENMKKLEAAARIPGDTPPPIEPEADAAEPKLEALPVLGAESVLGGEPVVDAGQVPGDGAITRAEPAPKEGLKQGADSLPEVGTVKAGGDDGNTPSFPVLDASKIQAFDEGREAERDVQVEPPEDNTAPDDEGAGEDEAKEP